MNCFFLSFFRLRFYSSHWHNNRYIDIGWDYIWIKYQKSHEDLYYKRHVWIVSFFLSFVFDFIRSSRWQLVRYRLRLCFYKISENCFFFSSFRLRFYSSRWQLISVNSVQTIYIELFLFLFVSFVFLWQLIRYRLRYVSK